MEETIKTECYQCREAHETDPEVKILPALPSPLFPFCCQEHKDLWGVNHFGKRAAGPKYKTIEECQQRLREMRDQKFGKVLNKLIDNREIFDVAKEIFG